MFIYIDESGDMEPYKGTPYFVIAAVFYYEKDSSDINRVINIHNKFLWENGWPKDIEIKATHLFSYKSSVPSIESLKINPRYYLQTIYRDINKLKIKMGVLINETSKQGPMLKCLHKEKIYNFLSKQLYFECFSFLRDTMYISADQRNIKLIKQEDNINLNKQRFNIDYIGYIRNELSFLFSRKRGIQPIIDIRFEDAKKVKGLQIADYIAWATRKKYEGRPYWFNLLQRIEKIEKKDNFT